MRALRFIVPSIVLALVVAVAALVLYARPQLDDARDDVSTRWITAATALDERYALLAAATGLVRDTPGPAGELAHQVDTALARWLRAREADRPVADEVQATNQLEAAARRLDAAVRASPRLSADPAVIAAFDAFAATLPEPVASFQAAVRAYADERDGTLRRVVADTFGYDPIPVLDVRPTA
jgi:hypothetical protein